MTASTGLVLALLVLGWTLIAGRVEPWGLSGPMVFLAAGALLAQLDIVNLDVGSETLMVIVELALVLSLFSDASTAELRELRGQHAWPGRMLLIGLPLSIAVGAAVAMGVLPALSWPTAVLLAASLAATDASLSAGVLSDARVPKRIRLALHAVTASPLAEWIQRSTPADV